VPSLVAARAGATVLATDEEAEALELVERNARENGLEVETALVDWREPEELVARGPFDLALAADVLYGEPGLSLLPLLPRLTREAWLADPGRAVAGAFVDEAHHDWSVETSARDGIAIHRLRS
jgi:predicted nicotinamide N-methyase